MESREKEMQALGWRRGRRGKATDENSSEQGQRYNDIPNVQESKRNSERTTHRPGGYTHILIHRYRMVQRSAGQGARRGRQQHDQAVAAGSGGGGRRHYQQELLLGLRGSKGKGACRFKRSCFSEEEDAASSAMLLLACVVCAPSSSL
ncbi:hypothetical protein ZWY2020_029740 [Hordeum vulgare]|nr:hypothetical protein ZWY2020_029740 [Hordeum vulgare]